MKKTYASLAELVYVFIILFLFMYIFALLGMELFANRCQFTPDLDGELVEDVPAAHALNLPMQSPRENFDDTVGAITTVFILTIGEDWPVVMYNYTRVYAHSQLIMLYFLITYSMGNFAMLSLFTAVVTHGCLAPFADHHHRTRFVLLLLPLLPLLLLKPRHDVHGHAVICFEQLAVPVVH